MNNELISLHDIKFMDCFFIEHIIGQGYLFYNSVIQLGLNFETSMRDIGSLPKK